MKELPILIYDGDCAFCSSSIRALRRLVPRGPKTVPYQWSDLNALGLTEKECEDAVQFVDLDSAKSSGATAFANYFIRTNFPIRYLGYFMKLPVISFVSRIVYSWIAKNRYKLPGGTPACKMKKDQ